MVEEICSPWPKVVERNEVSGSHLESKYCRNCYKLRENADMFGAHHRGLDKGYPERCHNACSVSSVKPTSRLHLPIATRPADKINSGLLVRRLVLGLTKS